MPNADQSMCSGDGCWLRHKCWHHARHASDRQRWHVPEEIGEKCREFEEMGESDE